MICYLWDLVKTMESITAGGNASSDCKDAGEGETAKFLKQMRKRVRVEMRRYFLRRRRRNVKMICGALMFGMSAIVLFGVFLGIDRVSGNSMYPYLNHGDWIVYSRMETAGKRDEIVVFEKKGERMVKRIVGLPGDTVEISSSGGQVVVNGVPVREDYVTLAEPDQKGEQKADDNRMGSSLTVMEGQYLVLGDNRSVSIDSRDSHIGTVAAEEILGRVLFLIRLNG